jgi:hypothetical protein
MESIQNTVGYATESAQSVNFEYYGGWREGDNHRALELIADRMKVYVSELRRKPQLFEHTLSKQE